MTTTVRVAVPAGQHGAGVSIKYGSQVAEIPVGGVHTFYLYEGQQEQAVITELGVKGPFVYDCTGSPTALSLQAENDRLKDELADVKEQLAAVHKAIGDANGESAAS